MQPILFLSAAIQSYSSVSNSKTSIGKLNLEEGLAKRQTDAFSLSPVARAMQAAKTTNTDTDFYPPGFPEAIKNHLEAMKNAGSPDIDTWSVLSMELVVDPQMDLDHSPALDGSIVMNRDVFLNPGFSMKRHIQSLFRKAQSQLGQGKSIELNNRLIDELNRISSLN